MAQPRGIKLGFSTKVFDCYNLKRNQVQRHIGAVGFILKLIGKYSEQSFLFIQSILGSLSL